MNAKRATISLVALALTLIVIGVFAAQTYQQKIFKYSFIEHPVRHLQVHSSITSYRAITIDKICMLAVTPCITVEAPNVSQSLINTTRNQIYDFISENPGIQFRAICAGLFVPVGLAQYHLGVLIRSGLVSFVRDGRYKRFFISKRFTKREMATICLLRHKTAKRIIEALLCKKQLSHGSLAGEVRVTSQALTWQMKTLRSTEYVLQVNEGLKTIYSLDEALAPVLKKYLAIVK